MHNCVNSGKVLKHTASLSFPGNNSLTFKNCIMSGFENTLFLQINTEGLSQLWTHWRQLTLYFSAHGSRLPWKYLSVIWLWVAHGSLTSSWSMLFFFQKKEMSLQTSGTWDFRGWKCWWVWDCTETVWEGFSVLKVTTCPNPGNHVTVNNQWASLIGKPEYFCAGFAFNLCQLRTGIMWVWNNWNT